MYSITDLKNDLEGVLHGTTTNQIQNLDGVINRAARQLLLDLDPQETKRTVEFITPIFNSVYDYPIAVDVKGNKLIDIFPQVQRLTKDVWTQAYNQAFDVTKSSIFSLKNMFTMDFNSGIKTIRVSAPFLNPPIIVNQIESITSNGTWAVGGNATNLAVNNTNFAQGSGSLQFNTTAGVSYIENSTMAASNLSNVALQASLFTWVYVPTASNLNSVTLRLGSDSSNYYTSTVVLTQQGTTFVNGWNLCQFDWKTMSNFGSPNSSAISYARIELNMSGTNTGVKINGLDCVLGSVLSYSYYSKYLFRDSATNAFQETVTNDSNLVNLDTESYNLLFNQVAYLASQQQQGQDALSYDGTFFKNAYDSGVERYKAMYKSELQKPQSSYYPMNKAGYNKIIGRGFNS